MKKYLHKPINVLYWDLNLKKMQMIEKKETNARKFISDELKERLTKWNKLDPYETMVIKYTMQQKSKKNRMKHMKRNSTYLIYMDKVLAKARQKVFT